MPSKKFWYVQIWYYISEKFIKCVTELLVTRYDFTIINEVNCFIFCYNFFTIFYHFLSRSKRSLKESDHVLSISLAFIGRKSLLLPTSTCFRNSNVTDASLHLQTSKAFFNLLNCGNRQLSKVVFFFFFLCFFCIIFPVKHIIVN